MLDTSPAVAVGTALLAVALLLGPGLLLLRLVGMRGLLATALAPACSTAVLGVGAILAGLLGVRWSIPVALGACAIAVGAALLVRALTHPPARDPATARGDLIALALGLLLAVVPTLLAAGSVDAYLQRWDAVYHLSALQLIDETGSASSLTLGSLSYGDGHAAVYPAGWHALASLLPGSPTAVLNLGSTVTSALPWVLGCAVLALQLARSSGRPYPGGVTGRGLAGAAGLLAGLVTATPMSLWIGWGHVPNAAGLAMVPAAVALGLRLAREREGRAACVIVLMVALLGMGLAHPNTVLATGALLLPALVGAVVASVRASLARGRHGRAVVVPAVALAVLVIGVAVFLLSPLAAAVTGYSGGSTQSVVGAIADVVTGRYVLWSSAAGVVVALIALAGVIADIVRRRWLAPAMLGVAWLLYLDAATGGHLQLSRLWYTSPARLSVVVSTVVVPVAAIAVVEVAQRWRERARGAATAGRPARSTLVPGVVAAVLLVVLAVPSVQVRSHRTASVYELAPGNPPQFVTTGELAMIAALPDQLDGTVLGSPFSGASSAYGLVGIPVVFPVAGQVWSADQQLVMDNLDDLATGTAAPEVCDAVDRLDIRYLYSDSVPYQDDNRYESLDSLVVEGGAVIAEADTARVVQLPGCGS